MDIEESKQFLLKFCPKAMTLKARREFNFKYPLTWTEHREGGGVIIDSAYWNFSICTEQEICKIANLIQTTQEMFEKFKDYSLFNFCELFNKHK